MFGRRMPPQRVFLLSLLLGLACLVPAVLELRASSLLPAVLWAVLGVWFLVDAARAYGWMRERQRREAQEERDLRKDPGEG